MKVAFPFGEWGRAHKCALDEVLVIKDFYCQLLGETRCYNYGVLHLIVPHFSQKSRPAGGEIIKNRKKLEKYANLLLTNG